MAVDAFGAGLRRILTICVISAPLAGCGGVDVGAGSGDPTSTVSSATSSSGAAASSSSSGVSSSSSSGSSSSSSSGASATALSTVALSASEYTVAPDSNAVLTIYRSGSTAGTATVGYSTVNGSATAGTDYTATSGTLSWSEGESAPKTVKVPVKSAAAGKEFSLGLTSVEGDADFGSPASAMIKVRASATVSSSGGSSSSSSSSGSSGSSSSSGSGSSATYSVTLSWAAPTLNTNGTVLTNLSGYIIYYGRTKTTMLDHISINTVGLQSYVITDLTAGAWYFDVVAVNAAGDRSNPSAVVSTTL